MPVTLCVRAAQETQAHRHPRWEEGELELKSFQAEMKLLKVQSKPIIVSVVVYLEHSRNSLQEVFTTMMLIYSAHFRTPRAHFQQPSRPLSAVATRFLPGLARQEREGRAALPARSVQFAPLRCAAHPAPLRRAANDDVATDGNIREREREREDERGKKRNI